MVVYLLLVWRQSAAGRRAERHRHATQQAELEQLISALAAVGEGDLTRQLHADGETAAVLAASINSAVEALRRLVAAVARQSEQLGGQSDSHQRASHALAEGANSQLEQLAAASATLGQLASSIDAIASRAGRSRLAAEQARDNAAEGVQRVAESSASVDQIDAAISVAAGSLEALQTGAAEIGKVAAVITEIADQTNVLALNAAIQATGSGQEARGFAVVADEIQRLAESAAGAAAEIGELIGSVQSYSAQAGAAMVNSCAELAVGKQRIAAAGSALAAIEQGAQTLLPLIAEISTASAEQAEQSKQIAVGVNEVQQQAAATLSRSHANAASMEELARLAVEMRRSVSHFQLGELETVELEQNAEPDNPLEAFEREIEQLLANTPKPGSAAE
jgi:twitching motility protein PilJ